MNKIKLEKKHWFLIGRLLMIVGILIPLYAFLSITINDLKKANEYEEYIEKEAKLSREEKQILDKKIKRYNKSVKDLDAGAVDPFTGNDFKARYNIEGEDKEAFSYIRIPKIDVTLPVYLGASYKHLAMGAAHVDGTNLPVGGKGTRSVIAGHRGFYKDTMFLNLHELEKGDEIIIRRGTETLIYKVTDSEVINPYDWDKLDPIENEDILTLLTCDPIRPPSPYRLIVNAKRYEPPKKEGIENEVVKIESTPVKREVKTVNTWIYVGTVLLSILFLYVLVSTVVKYGKMKRKEEE